MTELLRKIDNLKDLEKTIPPAAPTGDRIAVVLDGTHVPIDRSGNK